MKRYIKTSKESKAQFNHRKKLEELANDISSLMTQYVEECNSVFELQMFEYDIKSNVIHSVDARRRFLETESDVQ